MLPEALVQGQFSPQMRYTGHIGGHGRLQPSKCGARMALEIQMLETGREIMVLSLNKAKMAGGLAVAGAMALAATTPAAPAFAQASSASDFRNTISNNMRSCAPGGGPAVRVTISGIKSSTGKIRAQVYNGTSRDWLESGRWLNRIELPARRGRMTVCMPVPSSGSYAIAVRHDANNNGETDISQDGGGMSNNPSINIFNLGRPGVDKTRFSVNGGVRALSITMKYL